MVAIPVKARVAVPSNLPMTQEMWLRHETLLEPVVCADDARLEKNVDVVVCRLTQKVTREWYLANPGVVCVANYGVGYDNIDVVAATELGVAVLNTLGALVDATADLTFGILLAMARHLREGDALVRSGNWRGLGPTDMLGLQLAGKTLGLIGFGQIGQAVARRAIAFGMHVMVAQHRPLRADDVEVAGVSRVSLDEMLAQADIVSLHCPLTEATRGILSGTALQRMKRGSYVVNTARGACLDEDALVDCIDSGHLAGAALDVYVGEPSVNPKVLNCDKIFFAPHIGSATRDARFDMASLCLDGVAKLIAGTAPDNLVNRDVWDRRRNRSR